MPNYREDRRRYVADEDTDLKAPARNKAERRQALNDLLSGDWKNTDIGLLERIDDGDDHGWEMCPWKKDPS